MLQKRPHKGIYQCSTFFATELILAGVGGNITSLLCWGSSYTMLALESFMHSSRVLMKVSQVAESSFVASSIFCKQQKFHDKHSHKYNEMRPLFQDHLCCLLTFLPNAPAASTNHSTDAALISSFLKHQDLFQLEQNKNLSS